MTADFPWLTAMIVWPLVGAAAIWALPRPWRGRSRELALAVALGQVVLAVGTFAAFDVARAWEHQLVEVHAWIPYYGISYAVGVNGVGLLLVGLSVLLVPLVLLAAWRENSGDTRRERLYTGLVLVLLAFMVAVFSARDLFFFYLLFEAMLIPVYFLIGIFGGAQRRYAAVKFLLYSLAGGLVMLVAVIVLYLNGPGGPQGFLTENLTGLALDPGLEKWLFLGFFIPFAVKAPMFPVHTWLPDVAQNARAGTSTLLVAVLDKTGTFGMLTLCLPFFPGAARWAAPVIVVLAIVSIIYGGLLAIGQSDLMRLIAYTSISHFGFIVLGIFAFTSTSIAGASLYMVNHGLSTAALFLVAGFLVARRGSQLIADYGGLQKVVPVLAGVFLVAGLSALSLPGLSTFVSEFLVLAGTFARSGPAAVAAAVGVVLAAIYVLWTYQRVFTGPVRPGLEKTKDLSRREKLAIAPLVVALVGLGLYPTPALPFVNGPAHVTMDVVGVEDPPSLATSELAPGGTDGFEGGQQ